MSNLNLKPLTDKLTSIPGTLVENSSSSSGREVEVGQVQAGADFNPIDIDTPLALEEREVSPLEVEEGKISPYCANEVLLNIFSYLIKFHKEYFLSIYNKICKELMEYFLDEKLFIVKFTINNFPNLTLERQEGIINLIQKINVRLSIIHDMAFENLTTILSQRPFIFGDAQDPLKKIIKLNLSLVSESGCGPILDFLSGCKFLKNLHFSFINENLFFTIPESLSNLKTLSFRHIRVGASVRVPKALTGLESLSLSSNEASNVLIEKGMPALKSLHYEDIVRLDGGIIEVPQSLPALETLSFGSIRVGHVSIPGDLPALTSIFFAKVDTALMEKTIIKLENIEGGFPALKTIFFGKVNTQGFPGIVITMPENLKQYIKNLTPALENLIKWV